MENLIWDDIPLTEELTNLLQTSGELVLSSPIQKTPSPENTSSSPPNELDDEPENQKRK
jgi:hypothetical protein